MTGGKKTGIIALGDVIWGTTIACFSQMRAITSHTFEETMTAFVAELSLVLLNIMSQ